MQANDERIIKGMDLTDEELKNRIAKLELQKQLLEKQIKEHEERSEELKVAMTKTNLERLEKMGATLHSSMQDLLNAIVEYVYLAGVYKQDLRLHGASCYLGNKHPHEILNLGDFLLQREEQAYELKHSA
ncbi:MAG: hypothetical protein K6F05_08380 [Succinivibrio sp.]|nr:hypothetical protein [Succinivibrio sp.]